MSSNHLLEYSTLMIKYSPGGLGALDLIYLCLCLSVWDDPTLSVCLAYVIMRFPCTSAVDSINIYIALNVVIQSWQIYCIRMKTEFLMNSIWSPSGNSIYTWIFFTPFLWLLCDMVWIYFIFFNSISQSM